ncbi:carbohydrate ABC transporter permease [Aestuariivirga sp. YIM B02566]|uniref:Sugar ABC transporter permease n=1 Tax=Taklimakanibacter albus TaxID=2800327 RepID=A0ACC5RAL3_9HYPH|nr:sugar ABC transporter permease [Aestuariivirga sp. YIM B02566]MBK1869677.1 sugar ABC transporter permease [Aestuariivirga sp. YIM B02566]
MRWTGKIRFLFLAPAVIWVLAFTVFPLGYSLYLAFYKIEQKVEVKREKQPMLDAAGQPVLDDAGQPRTKNVVIKEQVNTATFIGLDNFKRMLTDTQVHEAVRVTLTFVLIAVPLELALGFLLAVLFNQHIFGRPILRAIMILPIFATPLAVGYTFFTIFYEVGGPLAWTGIPFLSNPTWALMSVIIVDVWQWTPFCFLVFLAALQGVPDELYEAARVDGANAWDMLKEVMLPLLIPTIVIVLLLRMAEALKLFDIPFALTGGGPGVATQPFSMLAFRTGLRFFDLGYASAMSYAFLAVIMIVITLFFRRLRANYG